MPRINLIIGEKMSDKKAKEEALSRLNLILKK